MSDPDRREAVKAMAAGLAAAAVSPRMAAAQQPATSLFAAPAMDRVRVGFVGVGGQGSVHVENFLTLDGVDVKAICDIDPAHAASNADKVVAAGHPRPVIYDRGPRDFERMIGEEELDLVFTATPW